MALTPGTRLGPYEIAAQIGVGGMGEVYRARDTRLDRTVALKVLRSHAAADPDFRQRFEREARAISQLDHPNICALYDIGRDGGIDFLVMQYLEGETLAERIRKGPLSLGQALKTSIEICDALHKAHRQGIVHRDFKPSNVMLTITGAKLLDFGLARTGTSLGSSADAATVTSPLTAQGTVQQFRTCVTGESAHRFVVHDHDTIYSPAVDGALRSMGLRVLKTPVAAPQAKDYASHCTSFV